MKRRVLQWLRLLSVAVIFLVCQARVLANQKDDVILASMEYKSWVDLGQKSIFFSDGTGYILKSIQVDKSGRVQLHPLRVKISKQQIKELINGFDSNHFIDIPQELTQQVTDGNELYVYFANFSTYHRVKDYMVENHSLTQINECINKVSDTLTKGAIEVSLDQMLTDMRVRLKNLPNDSHQYKCLQAFSSLLVGHLIGSQQIDFRKYKDLRIEGVY